MAQHCVSSLVLPLGEQELWLPVPDGRALEVFVKQCLGV